MSSVDVHQVGGTAIVKPKSNLEGGAECDELKRTLKQLSLSGNKDLVIDLENVKRVNSAGVATLITAHRDWESRGGRTRLVRMNEQLLNLMAIMKLSLVFDIYDRLET